MTPHDDGAPTTAERRHTAADRVCRGSERLVTLLGRRVASACRTCWARGSGWLDDASGLSWVVRAAALAGGALVAARIGVAVLAGAEHRIQAERWLMFPATGAWLVASYRVGHSDWQPKGRPTTDAPDLPDAEEPDGEADPDGAQDDDGTAAREVTPTAAPLPTRGQLAAALHHLGTPHCHTAALAEGLGITVDRAREALAAAGIPTDTVRMRGRGSSTGVRCGDFPPLPLDEEGTLGGVVAAGERANNNDNNRAYYLAADPEHPHRTHVVWERPAAGR